MIAPPPRLRRRMVRRVSRASPAGDPPGAAKGAVIPYDYGATFAITGQPGNIVQDVISISPDGVFVAVAIGYGFEEERGRRLVLTPQQGAVTPAQGAVTPPQGAVTPLPGDLSLGDLPPSALIEGFRVNPRFESLVLESTGAETNGARGPVRDLDFTDLQVTNNLLFSDDQDTLFQRVKARNEISFLFSVVDSSSGRELQDEPTHNLASLGKSDGERPFRLLAQPITFLPRSTIRLQIVERTEKITGTLFIVLYGYKVLGSSACPETVARRLTGPPACPVETIGHPSDRVIPFDYVTTIQLSGRPKNLLENETTVSSDGGFVATSVGYGLLVEETGVALRWDEVNVPKPAQMNLAAVKLRQLPPSALIDGIRIRPDLVRIAFQDNGALASALPASWFDQLFERLNRVEDVSFRYAMFDSGRGRELQNQPLHNVAGLGIANGDRPFKRLARPMVFLPRSTIRLQVEERFGRGTLFFVMQGYKILGPSTSRGHS